MEVHDHYPFVSDASYLAWRAESPARFGPHFPAWGHEYHLPWESAQSLDLDVVNLGPWGRDAHSPHERVHARYAFERLPRLIEKVVREAARS